MRYWVSEPGSGQTGVIDKCFVNCNCVDFLKIDIEGFKIKVMPSVAGALKKINNMFFEYNTFANHPQRLSTIISIIKEAGFRNYIKETVNEKRPFVEGELFYGLDMLVNIFCYRS